MTGLLNLLNRVEPPRFNTFWPPKALILYLVERERREEKRERVELLSNKRCAGLQALTGAHTEGGTVQRFNNAETVDRGQIWKKC